MFKDGKMQACHRELVKRVLNNDVLQWLTIEYKTWMFVMCSPATETWREIRLYITGTRFLFLTLHVHAIIVMRISRCLSRTDVG